MQFGFFSVLACAVLGGSGLTLPPGTTDRQSVCILVLVCIDFNLERARPRFSNSLKQSYGKPISNQRISSFISNFKANEVLCHKQFHCVAL
uniref:Putative secreted protein n=1 Tax=Anopheles triannulatus TaxID=58253 RepID=A0A2M4B229_9DIPT